MFRGEDDQVSRRFTEVYQRKFRVLLNAQVSRARGSGTEVALDVSINGHTLTIEADSLLLATGRVPNTDVLDVGATGVEIDRRGFVKTDEYLETNVPGIWALGDIVGKYLLKHSANLEAAHVANNIFNPDTRIAVDYHAMPHAVFASPQVASVGITEQEAQEASQPVEVLTAMWKAIYDDMVADAQVLRDNQWPHTVGLLRVARDAYCSTALATMSHRAEALHVLRALDLEGSLDVVLAREDVEKPKPDPEIYSLAAQKLNAPPSEWSGHRRLSRRCAGRPVGRDERYCPCHAVHQGWSA